MLRLCCHCISLKYFQERVKVIRKNLKYKRHLGIPSWLCTVLCCWVFVCYWLLQSKEKNSEQGVKVKLRHPIWKEGSVIADTSTSCFSSCIIQVNKVLAVGMLTEQMAEYLSSCFVYVTPRRDEKCGMTLETNGKWRCHPTKQSFWSILALCGFRVW